MVMEEKHIVSPRGKVFYWISSPASETRSEKVIMFSHGLTADHTLFDKQIPFYIRHCRVIVWDLPLHGKSRPYSDFTFRNTSEDMKTILDNEGIDRAVMVGQSGGGYVAQSFALLYPERISAYVSIGSTPFGARYYKKSELFWTNHFTTIARLYPYSTYCKLSVNGSATTKEAQESFYNSLKKLGKKDMLIAADRYYKDFKNYDEVNFTCPVLLYVGEQDKTGYVQRYNKEWSAQTGYKLITIPNAAHNANYDNYEFFNNNTLEFLSDNLAW